jgi:hypothetical protein
MHDKIYGNLAQMWTIPSHVRVRVLGCIVRVLTQVCNINKRYEVDYRIIIGIYLIHRSILSYVLENPFLESL